MLEEEVWCGVSKSEPETGAVPGQERAPSPGREGSGPRRAAGGTWQRAERRIVRPPQRLLTRSPQRSGLSGSTAASSADEMR